MTEDPKTTGDIEGASPEQAPANVVTDNAGVVPVQPVGTSDPTLDDNTNPKVPFDGADPRNIPPHDSNEQLHIAAAKRFGADLTDLTTAADTRREAVTAAYDNSRDVRDVLGENDGDQTPAPAERRDAGEAAISRAQAAQGNRAQPPTGRRSSSSKTETTKA
jgi:hypothetical protein